MPRDKKQKDLFRETTMSFGEHLEELRVCLWRAVVGLVIAFILGLLAGRHVVDYIQTPLRAALVKYYQDKAAAEMRKQTQLLDEAGYPEDIMKIAVQRGLLPELVYLSRDEVSRRLGLRVPPRPIDGSLAPATGLPATAQNGASPVDTTSLETVANETSVAEPSASEIEAGETVAKGEFDVIPIYIWRDLKTDPRTHATALNPHEVFMMWVKASLVVGVVLASPWIFYQIWLFVAAGLYHHERKYIYIFLPISLGLFIAGAALAFFVVFGYVLNFLFTFNASMGIDPDPRISEWMSFVLMLPLGFGIAFQLPLVMFFLERIGIFTVEAYYSKWRVAVLVIFVIAMFLTPADPWSMILMAAPLCVLYFGGIMMCRLLPRRESSYDDIDDDED